MVYQTLHRDHIKAVTKQRFLEGNNQTSSAPATHHVSANKEVTGVRGEEFQMERLQRCCLHCISWRPERKSKGQWLQQSLNGATWSGIARKRMHTLSTNNKQGRMTTTEQLCSAGGEDTEGVFWGRAGSDGRSSQAVHQAHLSAARWEELCSSLTLPPGLRPARRGGGRGWGWRHVCQSWRKKDRSALKCEGLTEVGRRAGLVGFRELYYHLEDTERKWSALSNASSECKNTTKRVFFFVAFSCCSHKSPDAFSGFHSKLGSIQLIIIL